ncbi:MAG: GTP 3',8-cyclase [Phycisphaerae bacterium]|nr:GTP 3',8-cyclase [Phycisphaerae bacterium]
MSLLPILLPPPVPSPTGRPGGPRSVAAVEVLRISVTDRCNFRCVYCMPQGGVPWAPREELLTFEEIVEVVRAASGLGIGRFKITGGEPLVRRELDRLVGWIRSEPGVEEISLTTNGLLLAGQARRLADAGVGRVTVSLDTLDEAKFAQVTRAAGTLRQVLAGIDAARAAGMEPIKVNCVAMRGVNDDEIVRFVRWSGQAGVAVRFIEFMPLADHSLLADGSLLTEAEMRAMIEPELGPLTPERDEAGVGPAKMFQLNGGGRIGFISAMSLPFCDRCNRLRLTSTGMLRSCLFDGGEVDVRALLRSGAGQSELARAFVDCVRLKPEVHSARGGEQMSRIGG